jgi:hypothetical protein
MIDVKEHNGIIRILDGAREVAYLNLDHAKQLLADIGDLIDYGECSGSITLLSYHESGMPDGFSVRIAGQEFFATGTELEIIENPLVELTGLGLDSLCNLLFDR